MLTDSFTAAIPGSVVDRKKGLEHPEFISPCSLLKFHFTDGVAPQECARFMQMLKTQHTFLVRENKYSISLEVLLRWQPI